MTVAVHNGFANAACADDDNAAVLSSMRSDAGGMRVRRINRSLEGMLVSLELGKYDGFTRACQRKAGDNYVLFYRKTRVSEAAGCGVENFR
jgi:hypothetical protein